jgi:hypothetical protein
MLAGISMAAWAESCVMNVTMPHMAELEEDDIRGILWYDEPRAETPMDAFLMFP